MRTPTHVHALPDVIMISQGREEARRKRARKLSSSCPPDRIVHMPAVDSARHCGHAVARALRSRSKSAASFTCGRRCWSPTIGPLASSPPTPKKALSPPRPCILLALLGGRPALLPRCFARDFGMMSCAPYALPAHAARCLAMMGCAPTALHKPRPVGPCEPHCCLTWLGLGLAWRRRLVWRILRGDNLLPPGA